MRLLIGTSGWSYDDWVGPFYKKKSGKFSQYTQVFNTTEINSTFYRYPSKGMITGLIRYAPPGFIFSSKLPKIITHDKWLSLNEGVEDDTLRYLELVRPLAEKLGPILIQLRPKFNYDDHIGNLENFLEVIPSNYEWAVEFRHISWLQEETLEILRKHNVAYTIVDEPLLPKDDHITADFSYIRWHGHGERLWYDYEYSEEQLDEWVPKVHEIKGKARRTYGYFNNHFRANAVKNAVEFLNKMDLSTSTQRESLKDIIEFRKQAKKAPIIQTLDSFQLNEEDLSVADYLYSFTDAARISRAEKIKDNQIDIKYFSDELIEAQIRGYNIEIDVGNKVIKHNCDDWRKGKNNKRICKHVGKLFFTLPKSLARKILKNLNEQRDIWQFIE